MLEEFRRFNDEIEISNLGNVKRNGELIQPYKDEYYYCITIDGKSVRIHTLVGRLFPEICGEWHKYYHFHHLNRNQLDNRAENIVCLSPSEHKKLHLKEDGVSVAVKAYDLDGNFVGKWDSRYEAAEETGISYRHIVNITSGKERRFTAGKLYWFKSEIPEEKVQDIIKNLYAKKHQRYQNKFQENIDKSKRVVEEYDYNNNLLKVWKSVKEIAEYYNVNVSSIYANISGKSKYLKKNNRKNYFRYKIYSEK